MTDSLTSEELRRYSRHLLMPEIGLEGQKKLKAARVLLIGAGGLGSPAGLYLAAAGVGQIGIVDYDTVELSNLQRQVIHSTTNLGELKAVSAQRRMLDINPDIQVTIYPEPFTSANAEKIAADYDIILDGSDNFPTRYLVNDLCVLTGKPFVYGAVYRFEGQASVFDAHVGPCYRCIFPQPPPPELTQSCSDVGVAGVMPGMIGMIQATEVIKLILGVGEPLVGRLMLIDALDFSVQTVTLEKNPRCPVCGANPTIHELIDYAEFCGVPLPGHVPEAAAGPEITPGELAAWLKNDESFRLVDVRNPVELQISGLPGADLVPYDGIPRALDKFAKDEKIVLFCRTGVRSARAQRIMINAGFQQVYNLKGGINAWAAEVDPGMTVY